MEQKIISAEAPEALNSKIKSMIEEGWVPIGSHQVVIVHAQNRYSGMQHMDTRYRTEYSQTMRRNESEPGVN